MYVFEGHFESEVRHEKLGVISKGTKSIEYYWKSRWYNVFVFYEPDGSFRNFYCNINMPPTLKNDKLDYVDLDIDLLIDSNNKIQLLDSEEFEANRKVFGYPDFVALKVKEGVGELIKLHANNEFPFNIR